MNPAALLGIHVPDGWQEERVAADEADIAELKRTVTESAWRRAIDLDLSTLPNQTLGADGSYTLGANSWTRMHATKDRVPMALVNGQGIVIQPVSDTDFWGSAYSWCALEIGLVDVIPGLGPTTPIRARIHVPSANLALNYDHVGVAFRGALQSGNGLAYTQFRVITARVDGASWAQMDGARACQTTQTPKILYQASVLEIEMPLGIAGLTVIGSRGDWASGFPAKSAMTAFAQYTPPAGANFIGDVGSAGDWKLVIGAGRSNSTNDAFSATIAHVQLDYRS